MNQLPNLIIAGVNKAATTSLFKYLNEHPDVCGSSVKETCFFLPLRYGETPFPMEEYFAFFEHCRDQRYILESTPGYFYGGTKIAKKLKDLRPDMKIVILLREPGDRLISFFRYKKDMMILPQELSLDEYIAQCEAMPMEEKVQRRNDAWWGVEGGYYAPYLREWFDVFGNDLKVVFFDDINNDPLAVLEDLSEWLSLDPTPFRTKPSWSIENRSISYRSGFLHRPALFINHSFEKFFRAHPALKQSMRRLYFFLNEKSDSTAVLNQAQMEMAQKLYGESNIALEELLVGQGYSNFPSWLQGGP